MATNFKVLILTTTLLVLVGVSQQVSAAENWDDVLNVELDTSDWIDINDMSVGGAKSDKKTLKTGTNLRSEMTTKSEAQTEETAAKIEEPAKSNFQLFSILFRPHWDSGLGTGEQALLKEP